MVKKYLPYLQYVLPQRLLSSFAGLLANSSIPWLKNWLIKRFIKVYNIDLSEAVIENPKTYPTFNQFFIRQLKPGARTIAADRDDIASPAEGFIAQIGSINQNQLLQAKNCYFNLDTLLANDTESAKRFYNGTFVTVYLAPNNYHRVHMPLDGQLEKTIYVPGNLFSVNRMTSELIPCLYGRNERLISIFNTDIGPMAVILVGAMLVGSIQTVWKAHSSRSNKIVIENPNHLKLEKGSELGYFELGSTVIVLFGEDKIKWQSSHSTNTMIRLGQSLGKIIHK
jgi:phosphatidylserine decarboxylase